MTDELLNTNGAARLLGVSRATVLRWRSIGRMPPGDFRISEGGRVGWHRSTLVSWDESGRPWWDRAVLAQAMENLGGVEVGKLAREDQREETPQVKEILDEFEAKLDACSALTRSLVTDAEYTKLASLANRFQQSQRESAIKRQTDGPNKSAGSE
jgi:hypothetical protein